VCLTYFIGTLRWQAITESIEADVDQLNLTPTDYTLELHGFPEGSNEQEIKKWINRLNAFL